MKKIIVASILLLAVMTAFSQKKEDVVYLKNGSIVRGKIIQNDPSKIKIESYGRNVWAFDPDEVEKTDKEKVPAKVLEIPDAGYMNITDAGLMMSSNPSVSLSFHTVNSFVIKYGISAGVGVGIDMIDNARVPVYGDIRYYPFKNKIAPYVYLQSGTYFDMDRYSYMDVKPGFLIGGGVGFINYLNSNVGLAFSVGFMHQQHSASYSYWYWKGDGSYEYTQTYLYNRLNVRFGIVFR